VHHLLLTRLSAHAIRHLSHSSLAHDATSRPHRSPRMSPPRIHQLSRIPLANCPSPFLLPVSTRTSPHGLLDSRASPHELCDSRDSPHGLCDSRSSPHEMCISGISPHVPVDSGISPGHVPPVSSGRVRPASEVLRRRTCRVTSRLSTSRPASTRKSGMRSCSGPVPV